MNKLVSGIAYEWWNNIFDYWRLRIESTCKFMILYLITHTLPSVLQWISRSWFLYCPFESVYRFDIRNPILRQMTSYLINFVACLLRYVYNCIWESTICCTQIFNNKNSFDSAHATAHSYSMRSHGHFPSTLLCLKLHLENTSNTVLGLILASVSIEQGQH